MGSTGLEERSWREEPSLVGATAVATTTGWRRLLLAGVLGVGVGSAAACVTAIAVLLAGDREAPGHLGQLVTAVGIAAGVAATVGTARALRSETDERPLLHRPPGWVFGLAVWSVCFGIACLATGLRAFESFFLLLLAVGVLAVLGVVWLVRLIATVTRGNVDRRPRAIGRWLVAPLAVVALGCFGLSGAAEHLQFEVSESALTADAEERVATADADLLGGDGWARADGGRFGVLEADSVIVRMTCDVDTGCDRAGASVDYVIHGWIFTTFTYTYRPAGPPPGAAGVVVHLGGPWWYHEARD